jgi:UDP-glucose 4-epimerase
VAALRSKRILVTGGGGFVGSHIVDLALAQKCGRVVAIDNFTRGRRENLTAAHAHPNFALVEGDIRDRALMRELVQGSDVVFHQAALRITQCAAEPRAALETMVDATFDLAELCASAQIQKVVFASSASIYGMAETFPTPERHHAHDDRTLYGVAKLFGEGALRALKVPHVALRYFNVYGPRMDIHGRYTEVLIRWMERIESGLPPIIFGTGEQTMDFVDVRDVARANLLAAESDLIDGAFNIASGVETSLAQLAAELAAVMDRPLLAADFQPPRSVNAVGRRLADTESARRMLGFSAVTPLRQGLRDLVVWWRTQRQMAPAVLDDGIMI